MSGRRGRKLKKPKSPALAAGESGGGMNAAVHGGSHTRLALVVGMLLSVATFMAYARVLGHEFIQLDDRTYVTENPVVLAGLTVEGIGWAFTTMHGSNWHPLTWLSHMLDCELFGANAGYHHLVNLMWHCAAVWLLFAVLNRMTRNLGSSAVVALLFGVHPLHVESVAWVAERKDVLSTAIGLLALLAYVRYTERPAFGRYVFVAVLLSLGLAAKPMLVTWPCLMLLLDFWPLGRLDSMRRGGCPAPRACWRLVREKLPFFVLAAASCLVTIQAQRRGGAVVSSALIPWGARLANAMIAYVGYLGKTIWPVGLAVYYPHRYQAVPVWSAVGAAFLLAVITAAAIWLGGRRRYLIVGWLWYVGTLVPVIGLVQVGSQAMADRYTYVPLVGLFLLIVWAMRDIASGSRVRRVGMGLAGGAWIGLLAVVTWFQVGHWRNSVTLFEQALKVTTDNGPAHVFLARALWVDGRHEEAIAHYMAAEQLQPNEYSTVYNLGLALYLDGQIEPAIDRFRNVLRIDPFYAPAYFHLGAALARQGRFDEAVVHSAVALRLNPNLHRAHFDLGVALAGQGAFREAVDHFEQWLRVAPDSAEGHVQLGDVLVTLGELDRAAAHYTAALRIQPDDVDVRSKLAGIQAGQRSDE